MIICAPMISQMVAEGAVRGSGTTRGAFTASSSGGDTSSPTDSPRFQSSSGRRPVAGSSHSPASPAARTPPHSPGISSRTCTSSTIPGAAFGQSGEGCLRLSFGSVSGEGLVEGLDRLEDYFARGG